ncbi:MAG TPA: aminoglycoside phosphotransferase, partial [Acidimicrobiia bacterium]|nr:aminoglycoside phosphotransferase [Acidimicrobiia bacterium]
MPRLADSVKELLAAAERREPFVNPDGRSAAAFERVWIAGRPHIVKYVHLDDDFTMRVSGDIGCRPVRAWAAGLLDAAPGLVDHAVVGAAFGHGRNGWGSALLMRDVS